MITNESLAKYSGKASYKVIALVVIHRKIKLNAPYIIPAT
jgi:hypothetical protein